MNVGIERKKLLQGEIEARVECPKVWRPVGMHQSPLSGKQTPGNVRNLASGHEWQKGNAQDLDAAIRCQCQLKDLALGPRKDCGQHVESQNGSKDQKEVFGAHQGGEERGSKDQATLQSEATFNTQPEPRRWHSH